MYMRPAITVDDNYIVVNPFWTGAGGLRRVDRDFNIPGFHGDMVIRGGIIRFSLALNTASETVPFKIKLYLVWAENSPSYYVYNNVHNTSRFLEWEPTAEPDFKDFGRVVMNRQVTLMGGAKPFEVVHRLKPWKVGEQEFVGAAPVIGTSIPAGKQPWWMWQLIPLTDNAVADTVQTIISFNLSFAADASIP